MQPERNRVSFLKALLGATAGGVTLAKGEGGSHVHGCWAGLRGLFFFFLQRAKVSILLWRKARDVLGPGGEGGSVPEAAAERAGRNPKACMNLWGNCRMGGRTCGKTVGWEGRSLRWIRRKERVGAGFRAGQREMANAPVLSLKGSLPQPEGRRFLLKPKVEGGRERA